MHPRLCIQILHFVQNDKVQNDKVPSVSPLLRGGRGCVTIIHVNGFLISIADVF